MRHIDRTDQKDLTVSEQDQTATLGEKIIEQDAITLSRLFQQTLFSYENKPDDLSDKDWLATELKKNLPNISEDECQRFADETAIGINSFDASLKSINDYCDNGGKKEKWVSDTLINSCSTMSAVQMGEYLSTIDSVLTENNRLLAETIMTNSGTINQNKNLHGFIAEQLHVNSFNRNAALQGSDLRAFVLKPDGHGYGKNSVDIVVKDNSRVVERYQAKFCKDTNATANAVLDGNYNNQRILVPKEQQQGVADKLSTKSVSAKIGGNHKTESVTSDAISKKQALKLQERAQAKGTIKKDSWNSFSNKQLAMNVGKQVVFASVGSAALAVGIDTAVKALRGEKITPSEVAKVAVTVGADTGAKTAMAAALKIGTEKGLLAMIPKGVSGFSVAAVACVAVENIKVAYKVAKGEMTVMQGLDAMGRVTCSTIGGIIGSIEGGYAGGILGFVFLASNPVGLAIGAIAGMVLGSAAGAKIGSAIYSGVKAVAKGAYHVGKAIVKGAYNTGKAVVKGICSGVKSLYNTFFD